MKPVFVIDVNKCMGCRACEAACTIEHGQYFIISRTDVGLPLYAKKRTVVLWEERDEPGRVGRQFVSYLCYHCEKTPCLEVCPTGATFKTSEGIVLVDKDKCIGCRYCIMACPYGMRYIPSRAEVDETEHRLEYFKDAEEGAKYGGVLFQPPVPNKWAVRLNVVDKCTFCYHRKEGDKLWTPACVEVCPTKSRMFGDLDDPNDPVAELVRSGKAKPARPSAGTGGLVYYVGL